MNELLTIVIPVYNGEKHIGRALDSLIEQTNKNFKVIIVYDIGEDDTGKILEEYTNKLQFNLITNLKPVGQDAAWNIGHKTVETKYIGFLMDDDELYPNYIDEILRCINDTNADFIRAYWMKGPILRNPELDDNLGQCRVYTKKLWEEIGGFDETFDSWNDTDFWYKIKYHKPYYKIALIRKPLYRWYYESDNLSHKLKQTTEKKEERKIFEKRWKLLESRFFETNELLLDDTSDDITYRWIKDTINKLDTDEKNIVIINNFKFFRQDKGVQLQEFRDVLNTNIEHVLMVIPIFIGTSILNSDLNIYLRELSRYGYEYNPIPNLRYNDNIFKDDNGIMYYRLYAKKI